MAVSRAGAELEIETKQFEVTAGFAVSKAPHVLGTCIAKSRFLATLGSSCRNVTALDPDSTRFTHLESSKARAFGGPRCRDIDLDLVG